MAMSNEEMQAIIDEEMARFREDGYFKRLGKMFKGLGMPHDTKEYKIAAIELQRQLAPILAFLIVGLLVLTGLLIAIFSKKPEQQAFNIVAAPPEQQEEVEEEKPPEEPPPPPQEPVPTDDIPMDTPTIGTPSTVVNATPPTMASVQPSPVDAVQNIKSPVRLPSIASGRTAGRRGDMTKGGANYGDPMTENAVMRALRWLKFTQNKDGSWSVNPGHATILPADRGIKSPNPNVIANTSLALLSFLAHGETPSPQTSPEFHETVKKAIEYLTSKAYTDNDGLFRFHGTDKNEYAFLIAVYALSEAYAMTDNPDIRYVAEDGVRRIIKGQLPSGGWDYTLGRDKSHVYADISLGGWAIQALKAAKLAGIKVEGLDKCIEKAIRCLQRDNWHKADSCFRYKPNSGRRYYLSPVGCLAMQLLGYKKEKEVKRTLELMKNWQPTFDKNRCPEKKYEAYWDSPQYYMYYATQCKFQAGMAPDSTKEDRELWAKWNGQMKAVYPSSQKVCTQKIADPKGKQCEMGYWMNKDTWSTRPVMDTCLCALQLMVYYRYLPTTAKTVKETANALSAAEEAEKASKENDDVIVSFDL